VSDRYSSAGTVVVSAFVLAGETVIVRLSPIVSENADMVIVAAVRLSALELTVRPPVPFATLVSVGVVTVA
jgi:hypothetical protein